MNKVLTSVIAIIFSAQTCIADCDFSTGIKANTDGSFNYSNECNKRVGKMVEDLQDRADQVDKLNKTIDLKDLTIGTQEKRADMWMNTALKLEDTVNAVDKYNETNKWLYFGLGILVMGASTWAAGQLRH